MLLFTTVLDPLYLQFYMDTLVVVMLEGLTEIGKKGIKKKKEKIKKERERK